MDVTFVIAGRVTREYVLPPLGTPLLDAPGGSAMYACGGLLPWASEIGLLARVGEDYPRAWLKAIQARGIDVQGIQILPRRIDLREFVAYEEGFEVTRGSPVSQFARRKLPFPKELLGYQPPSAAQEDSRRPDLLSPTIADIPAHYRDARAVHICPLDFVDPAPTDLDFQGIAGHDPDARSVGGLHDAGIPPGPAHRPGIAHGLPAFRGKAARPVLGSDL